MAELPQVHAQKAKSYLSEPGSRAHRITRHCSERWLPEVRGPEEPAHHGRPILLIVNRQVSDVDLLLQKLLMPQMHRDDMQKNPKWQTSDKKKKRCKHFRKNAPMPSQRYRHFTHRPQPSIAVGRICFRSTSTTERMVKIGSLR